MTELVPYLRDHAFTKGLTESQIASLATLAHAVTFEENDLILVDGQHSKSFYLLTSGSVSIELNAAHYVVSVQSLERNQAFGWSALLDDQDTLFQVRARERTSALRLDGAKLKSLCRKDPALGVEILQRVLLLVAGRVKATETRFAEMCGVRVQ